MPGGSSRSRFLQRCVADVAGQGKELGAAFAICTAQSQKSGYSKPGAATQTARGAARERHFKGQADMGDKAAAYERAVRRGRKGRQEDTMRDLMRRLDEAKPIADDDDGGEEKRPLGRLIDRVVLPNSARAGLFEYTMADGSKTYDVMLSAGPRSALYVEMVDQLAANKLLDVLSALREDILGIR